MFFFSILTIQVLHTALKDCPLAFNT